VIDEVWDEIWYMCTVIPCSLIVIDFQSRSLDYAKGIRPSRRVGRLLDHLRSSS
jgi:hypothetical protein